VAIVLLEATIYQNQVMAKDKNKEKASEYKVKTRLRS
jgi:hypothetical protein